MEAVEQRITRYIASHRITYIYISMERVEMCCDALYVEVHSTSASPMPSTRNLLQQVDVTTIMEHTTRREPHTHTGVLSPRARHGIAHECACRDVCDA